MLKIRPVWRNLNIITVVYRGVQQRCTVLDLSSWCQAASCLYVTLSPFSLPVGHPGLVERHEVDLTRRTSLGAGEENLIISLAQELELLSFLVHEDSIKVSSLHTPDLYGLVAPAHDLSGPDVGHAGGQLPPLEHDVLGHLAVRVDIDALIIIAQQELHPVSVGQSDDGVRSDRPLGVFGHVDVVHTGRVKIHRVEAALRAIEDLETGSFLNSQVNKQRFVLQL